MGRVLSPFLSDGAAFDVASQAIWALDKFHFPLAVARIFDVLGDAHGDLVGGAGSDDCWAAGERVAAALPVNIKNVERIKQVGRLDKKSS